MKSIFLVEKALNPTRAAPVARLPFSNSGRSCLRAQQWQLDHSPSPYPKRTKFPPPVSKIVQMLRIQALRKFLSLRKLGKSGPDLLRLTIHASFLAYRYGTFYAERVLFHVKIYGRTAKARR